MPYHWENREKIADVRTSGLWGHVCWFLGAIFAILGIIADATNGTLGLTMMAWFMLAIVFHLAGLSYWMGYALAIHLKSKEAKKKE